jgi:putrescine transport system substrate-binding protein
MLMQVRPYIRSFDSVEYMNGLANQEVCVAMSWSSDYAQSSARARAVGVKLNLAFTVPREGANQTFSSLLIPDGAPHPEAAYEFINFLLRPEVIADRSADSRRCGAVSDARGRSEAVPVRRSVGRHRAHSHAHLDPDQDGQMMALARRLADDVTSEKTHSA